MADSAGGIGEAHSGLPQLSSQGIPELLENDPRPSLVFDLEPESDDKRLEIVFANTPLQRHPTLSNLVNGRANSATEAKEAKEVLKFKKWACGLVKSTRVYGGLHWTGSTLGQRWRIVNGNTRGDGPHGTGADEIVEDRPATSGPSSMNDRVARIGLNSFERRHSRLGHIDPFWPKALPDTPHVRFFIGTDWSATPLGPLETWSSLLRQMAQVLMADSRSASMFWGPHKVVLYNEPYVAVAGRKHPSLMGSTISEGWAEIAADLEPAFADAQTQGRANNMEDTPFFLERSGYIEETFFSFNLIPICDQSGATHGFYNTAFETTKQKVWERRTSTLLATATTPDLASYWSNVLKGLEYNDRDIPFAAIYSIDRMAGQPPSTSRVVASDQHLSRSSVSFEGGLGVAGDHPLAYRGADLDHPTEPLVRIFKVAVTTKIPMVLHQSEGHIPEGLTEGISWRGFEEPSTVLVVLALFAAEEITGFLVMGMNPRRAYDDDYDGFIQLLSRQLSTSLTSAVLMDRAKRKQAELSKDVAEGESRFKALTELNSAGLFYISPTGSVLYANDTWYDMTGFPRGNDADMAFMEVVMEEDREFLANQWHGMAVLREKRTFEIRLKKSWYHKSTDSWKYTWILACCGHEQHEDGSLKSVMGCITDISLQKQAEEDAVERAKLSEKLARSEQEANEIQVRSVIEAQDARKSMEKFMDITSHEMRNPLSAMLQSADGIATTLLEFQASSKTPVISDDLVESTLEAVQIITLCAQHQNRIINDVLTLSKIDSGMLQVSPTPMQPAAVVKGVMKMFEGELVASEIEHDFAYEKSYQDYSIEWAMADPSRVTQILINLMTNAIKFTRTERMRRIRVTIGGSDRKPPNGEKVNLEWFPSRGVGSKRDLSVDEEWGPGKDVYLYFAVQDSGRGLTDDEKQRLFHRFAQANPRTHIKYGGSGLGLFISRELSELHGGEIGLYSEAGKGSTFAFYVKGKRTSAPENVAQRDGPASRATASPLKGRTRHPENLPMRSKSPNDHKDSPLQILLVEDNLVNQKVLSKQLTKAGCVVHVANHGVEALEFLEKSRLWKDNPEGHALDIVLMDLEMPVMDGLTCARRIRELQTEGIVMTHVPLIAVTANARKEQIETSIAAGMDDVMPKPFRVADLLPKMEKLRTSQSPVSKILIEQPLEDQL